MGIIWDALTDKSCVNCIHMPKGYYCRKLKKRFDGHKIDRGIVPCDGKHFEHYATQKPIPLHVINREGEIIRQGEYKGGIKH